LKVARKKRKTISYRSIAGISRTVAKKKRRKRSWLRTLFLLLITPFLIWLLAFVLWFYWNDLSKFFQEDPGRSQTSPKTTPKLDSPAKNPSKETILEEDRRKLDEILKKEGG
jgi:hypothetical protein